MRTVRRWGSQRLLQRKWLRKSGLQGEHNADSLTHLIMHNLWKCVQQGGAVFFFFSPFLLLLFILSNKFWVPERKALLSDTRGILCQGQRGPAVGTEEADKEDWGREESVRGRGLRTDCSRGKWVSLYWKKNIFRYKKWNSGQSKNMALRVISSLSPGGGGEKDDGHIISHHGITSHPLRFATGPGQLSACSSINKGTLKHFFFLSLLQQHTTVRHYNLQTIAFGLCLLWGHQSFEICMLLLTLYILFDAVIHLKNNCCILCFLEPRWLLWFFFVVCKCIRLLKSPSNTKI